MEINEILLNDFDCQETKYYDEAIFESKLIKLETEILKKLGENSLIFEEIKKTNQLLQKMIKLRLIDFVIDKMKK